MPYSDNQMTYNERAHRYVLTQECVLEDMNIDLGAVLNTSDVADVAIAQEQFLDRVSRIIYSWIYSVNPLRFRTERELALNESHRPFILEAMKEQVLYILNNGDLTALSGINLDTGITTEESKKRASSIAPLSKDILIDAGIVKAFVPLYEREIVPNYQGEGY